MIEAKAGDIRRLTDAEGNRLWSVTDRPVPGHRAHAEIWREPRGETPGRAERDRFVKVWRGAVVLLTTLKEEDPLGKPELGARHRGGGPLAIRAGRQLETCCTG